MCLDSQSCDLDELAEQLDSLGQRLTLQDLGGDPVLHLAAALQYQLQVQGAPARLLPVKHVTHKLHLQKTPTKKKTEQSCERWTSMVLSSDWVKVRSRSVFTDLVHAAEQLPVKHHQLIGHLLR